MKLFRMVLKVHLAQHIATDLLASRVNPQVAWTYQDEDFVGRVADVAKASIQARGPTKVGEPL